MSTWNIFAMLSFPSPAAPWQLAHFFPNRSFPAAVSAASKGIALNRTIISTINATCARINFSFQKRIFMHARYRLESVHSVDPQTVEFDKTAKSDSRVAVNPSICRNAYLHRDEMLHGFPPS